MLVQNTKNLLPDFLVVGTDLDLFSLLKEVLNILILVIIITAIIYLMLNGLKFITSGGDQSKAQEAQKGIVYAIIGIIIALTASILVNFVLARLGVNLDFIQPV